MRTAILLLFILPSLAAQTQPDLWKQVDPENYVPRLQAAALSKVQQEAVARLILRCCASSIEEPDGSTLADTIQCLNFQEIPLAPKRNVLLISEEGTGCADWGTGGGGGMWLIRLDGDKPALLASPEDDFNGWLYSIQPSVSHGYHDLVLGWHMGACYTILTFFQFDGKSYNSVSKAADLCDEKGHRIDPNVPTDPN
jgi:hypothetical protein